MVYSVSAAEKVHLLCFHRRLSFRRSAKDIPRAVGISEKDVSEHLSHIARSVTNKGDEAFVTEPSRCLECGFVFRKRERLKTPSKCPVCRSEEITETTFGIEVKG